MTKRIRNHLAALLAVLPFAGPATALNLTDSWWNRDESGWGLYVTHQGDTAGIGLLLHDANGKPFHVTGGLSLIALTNPGGWPVMSGTLYASTGPDHAGPFDSALVTRQAVGTATFTPTSPTEASLVYTINGQAVQKRVSRLTIAVKDIGGEYRHVQRLDVHANPGSVRIYESGTLTVFQDDHQINMRFRGGVAECEYNGNYAQRGRYGHITGFYQCNSGPSGAFTMEEVERTASGLAGKFTELTGIPGFTRGGFTAVASN
jgi:hypothetical protein